MKKLLLLLPLLSSCNMQLVDLQFSYDNVHLIHESKCLPIASWTDYEDGEQLQVVLTNGTVMLVSANNAYLIKGKCPICG